MADDNDKNDKAAADARMFAERAASIAAYADKRISHIHALFDEPLKVVKAMGGAEVVLVLRLHYPNDAQKTLAIDVLGSAHCSECVTAILESGAHLSKNQAEVIVAVDVPPPTHVERTEDLPKTPTGETLQ